MNTSNLPAGAVIRGEYSDGYYSVGDVLYYHGDGFHPSDHRVRDRGQCRDLGWPWSPAQEAAYDAYLARVLSGYRASRSVPATPEERAEMRAAFGPGARVVDVITGRVTLT